MTPERRPHDDIRQSPAYHQTGILGVYARVSVMYLIVIALGVVWSLIVG